MKILNKIMALCLGLAALAVFQTAGARAQTPYMSPHITFNSFIGIYYLSRDSQNHSLLTTEEVILADFPANGNFYGITRAIPKHYQDRSVQVKVLGLTDAGGAPVPFRISSDKADNLVITTGDRGITIYGPQTYHISYQTRDVVNTSLPSDEFLLDINGRGWDQQFGQVSAIIHVPKSFGARLLSPPTCFIGYLKSASADCSVNSRSEPAETVINIKSNGSLAANHSLVAKLNFKQATFIKSQAGLSVIWLVLTSLLVLAAALGVLWFARAKGYFIGR